MANIIRCKLPNGVHRFKPFKVSDYRDFLLVRNDILSKDEKEEIEIVNELVADYFHEYPKAWQPYIFLQVFTGSIGKTKIPINFECPECGKVHKKILNLSMDELKNPEIEIGNVTLYFDFPEKEYIDPAISVLNCIKKIKFEGKIYEWKDVLDKSKKDIIDLITFDHFETITKMLKPFYFELNLSCCDKYKIIYDDITSLFKLLLNPDEVFPFYEINDILIKNKYDHKSIMELLPAERSMILALIERNNKK